MKIEVKLFAAAKELAGDAQITAELDKGATISDLRSWIGQRHPELAPLIRSAAFAIGAEYVKEDAVLAEGHEVACIPPVSGG